MENIAHAVNVIILEDEEEGGIAIGEVGESVNADYQYVYDINFVWLEDFLEMEY